MSENSVFSVFGLEPTFKIDTEKLQKRYYELCRQVHPDRLGQGATARSAELNQAYLILRDQDQRLRALLELVGVKMDDRDSAVQGKIPMELAEEYFEIQEDPMNKNKIDGFAKKISESLAGLNEQLFCLANEINWKEIDRSKLNEVVELWRERSYLLSLLKSVENLVL